MLGEHNPHKGSKEEKIRFSMRKLTLDERGQTLSLRIREYRATHAPWTLPEEFHRLFEQLGMYIHEGPGFAGTNTPVTWVEELTVDQDMVDEDRRYIFQKSEYAHERASILARLDRASTNEELDSIEKELETLEQSLARLETEHKGEFADKE